MNGRKSDGQRALKHDEKVLWNRVTRTITPMKPRVAQVQTDPEFEAHMRDLAVSAKNSQANRTTPVRTGGPKTSVTPPAKPNTSPSRPVRSPAPIAAHFDRPVYRKIAKGRLPIDATIDLHDMTQNQAIYRLELFLQRARTEGHRHVLVITGKGGSPTSEGALRRMLPIWLNQPHFASIVNGYQVASRGHGGDGAFYVRLRRY